MIDGCDTFVCQFQNILDRGSASESPFELVRKWWLDFQSGFGRSVQFDGLQRQESFGALRVLASCQRIRRRLLDYFESLRLRPAEVVCIIRRILLMSSCSLGILWSWSIYLLEEAVGFRLEHLLQA